MLKEKRHIEKQERKIFPKEIKAYFIIFNLIVAIFAFSFLIGYVDAGAVDANGKPVSGSTSDNNALTLSYIQTGLGALTSYNQLFNSWGITPDPKNPSMLLFGNTGSTGVTNPKVESALSEDKKDTTKPQADTKIPPKSNPPTSPADTKIPKNNSVPIVNDTLPTPGEAIHNYFDDIWKNLFYVGAGAIAGGVVGGLAGGKNGIWWGALSGASGVMAFQVARLFKIGPIMSGLIGLGVAAAIFILTYEKEGQKTVEFECNPWQAPIGGSDCEKCNDYSECSEYTCKSLGQACDLVNKGLPNQKCVWKNPYDTQSPQIQILNVTPGHNYIPFKSTRPPATGVEIKPNGGKCIKAFTPLEFAIKTDEPSQCKIDYNLTEYSKDVKTGLFDNMGYYIGGDSTFEYNHTEILSLPGPDAIEEAANKSGIQLFNDGTYTLYIRCQDANGNFNVDPYAVRFCVEPGDDSTPPVIVNVNIPSGSAIQYNQSSLAIEVYVNEPSNCRWSHEDGRSYKLMENNMTCANKLWDMNNQATYTCRANLTGIESRKENAFYFRCLDKPGSAESERNPDTQSYRYTVNGTQPLNIIKFGPDGIVKGATNNIAVNLTINTDNGNNNGEATCYYSTSGKEADYIEFSSTDSNLHTQRQDLIPGNYTYFYKCVDLGGNAAYNSTNFTVQSDMLPPDVVRVLKENGELKLITDKESDCSYSNKDCNFEVDDGIKMSSIDRIIHFSDWSTSKNYFIRCKDNNNNQPDPNVCSIIIRPVNLYEQGTAISL